MGLEKHLGNVGRYKKVTQNSRNYPFQFKKSHRMMWRVAFVMLLYTTLNNLCTKEKKLSLNYQKSCPFVISVAGNRDIRSWCELFSNFWDDFVVLDPQAFVDNYHDLSNTYIQRNFS